MSTSDFWASTPREVVQYIRGAHTRLRRAYRVASFQAYYAGAIARSGGDLPKYERMFPEVDEETGETVEHVASADEHLAFWETLATAVNAAEVAKAARMAATNGQGRPAV